MSAVTLRTYERKTLVRESNHKNPELAFKALRRRDGDTAVMIGNTTTVWFKRSGENWTTDRQVWHPERETA